MKSKSNYEGMAPDQIHQVHELESEVAELQIRLMDAHDCTVMMAKLWGSLEFKPEKSSHRAVRKGVEQAMHRLAKITTPDWAEDED